jgi:Tfp pilus assembly protein PilN
MKFQTDFASHEYRYIYGLQGIFIIASLLLVLLAVWNFLNYRAAPQEADRVTGSLKRVQEQSAQLASKLQVNGKALTPDQITALSKEVAFANELLQRKTFFWSSLLSDIEGVIPDNIALTRIQLDFKEQRVMLTGSAVSLKDLTQFIIRLEDSPAFKDVFLENQKTGEHEWVEFSLNAKYHVTPPSDTQKGKPVHEG